MMKKKMYNKPVVEYAEALTPMTIICASLLNGGNSSEKNDIVTGG